MIRPPVAAHSALPQVHPCDLGRLALHADTDEPPAPIQIHTTILPGSATDAHCPGPTRPSAAPTGAQAGRTNVSQVRSDDAEQLVTAATYDALDGTASYGHARLPCPATCRWLRESPDVPSHVLPAAISPKSSCADSARTLAAVGYGRSIAGICGRFPPSSSRIVIIWTRGKVSWVTGHL